MAGGGVRAADAPARRSRARRGCPRRTRAKQGDALAHANEAVPAAVSVRGAAAAVGDLERQLVFVVAHGHGRARGAGVLEGVGERLLDDPVAGQVDAGGSGTGSPSTLSSTGMPAARTWSTSSSTWARLGCGASARYARCRTRPAQPGLPLT
jgi:hypothetical protein